MLLLALQALPVSAETGSAAFNAPWVTPLVRGSMPPASSSARLLREQVVDDRTVISGRVGELQSLDDGALQVARVEVGEWWQGDAEASEVRVVDVRGGLRRQILPEEGTPLVAVLEIASPTSYLRAHLPETRYYAPAGGSTQSIHAGLEGSAAAALARWLAFGDQAPSAESREAAFELLRVGQPALARQALGELARVPVPESLAAQEREAVTAVMREALPGKGELALRLVHWGLDELSELLVLAEGDDPVTRSRVLQARVLLGEEFSPAALIADLEEASPLQRAAVLPVLALLEDAQALEYIGNVAVNDPHAGTRRVAIAALSTWAGRFEREPALVWLERAFDSDQPGLRSAAVQALAVHSEDIENRLASLVSESEHMAAREYAAGLLVLRVGTDDPRVLELRADAEAPGLRRVLEEGLLDAGGIHSHGPDFDHSPGHGHGHGHEHEAR